MKIPWTERSFDFSIALGHARELITRLEGAPARAAWYASQVDRDTLTRRVDETWSIQENIAHLADTDRDLFVPRLDQFDQGATALVPADMSNQATWAADHNQSSIADVLGRFSAIRASIVERLDAGDEAYFARTALHPRLSTPMRVVDLMLFKAEHDDYHLSRVRELIHLAR